jgi:hypothetical protein
MDKIKRERELLDTIFMHIEDENNDQSKINTTEETNDNDKPEAIHPIPLKSIRELLDEAKRINGG